MNKHKKNVIILFFVGISIFFINPVNADFVNGGFETGDFSGWSWWGDLYPDMTNRGVSSPGYDGNYKFWQRGENSRHCHLIQNVNLTGYDKLYFTGNTNHGGSYIYIDGNHVLSLVVGVETDYEIDVSGYSGVCEIKVRQQGLFHVGACIMNVDSFVLEEGVSEINFYPEQTNITPTHINYTIIDDDYTEDCFILIARNVSGSTYWIDSIWLWDELQVGSKPLNLMDYGENCTYYAEMYNNSNKLIATTMQEYIFNDSDDSIDPFPTPDPTPNITALPTYTPQPTPTGYPNQSLINNSLNSSWASAWFNLVENTISGLFLPIYNFWGWILHPVNLLHDILVDFSNQMSIFFNEASNKIVIATGILNTIFLYIPDKIVNLIGYYLLWLCIMLVFKGDT